MFSLGDDEPLSPFKMIAPSVLQAAAAAHARAVCLTGGGLTSPGGGGGGGVGAVAGGAAAGADFGVGVGGNGVSHVGLRRYGWHDDDDDASMYSVY